MSKNWKWCLLLCVAVEGVGCGLSPGTSPGAQEGVLGLGQHGMALVTLKDRVARVPATDDSADFRRKVEDYYPAICLDRDDDNDGVPSTFDDDDLSDDKGGDRITQGLSGRRGSDDAPKDDSGTSSDGGTSTEEDSVAHLRCQRCNRGPGTAGDFRLRISGTEARLERGRVWAVADGTFTVPSPDGDITVQTDSATRFDEGIATPGAEIRAEGTVGAGARTLLATRLTVLCPGPTPVADDTLPVALPEGGTTTDGGGLE